MKKSYTVVLFLSIFFLASNAQTPVSPIQSLEGKTVHAARFGLFFDQYNNVSGKNDVYQFLGRYDTSAARDIDTSDWKKNTIYNQVTARTRDLDFKAGDFSGDGIDDYVSAVLDTNDKPYVTYSRMDTLRDTLMRAAYSYGFEINNKVKWVQDAQSRINIATGDFDGSGSSDFVIGFVDSASKELRLQWYWLNGGTDPVLRNSLTVPKDSSFVPVTLPFNINSFHLCTGDFDGDKEDELAVVYLAPNSNNPTILTALWVAIFDMENGQFIFKGSEMIAGNLDAYNCSVASGYLADSLKADLAVAYANGNTKAGTMKVDLTQSAANVISNVTLPTYIITNDQCNLAVGDLNGDGWDEVVMAAGGTGYVLKVNHPLYTVLRVCTLYLTPAILWTNSGLQIADVNRDRKDEVIVAGVDLLGAAETFYISVYGVPTLVQDSFALKDQRAFARWSNFTYPRRRYAFAWGDFDGMSFTVGTPTHYFKPGIVQPLVILNAPPVHFDVLNGVAYDVNRCYDTLSPGCGFTSTYATDHSVKIEMSSTVSQDWGVDAKLSAGGSFGVVDVGGYMSGSYGEKFSKDASSSTTYTIGSEISAVDDDLIYLAKSDYDLWEYPIARKGKPIGNMMTVIPTNVHFAWINSKSDDALSYVPNHEVGCIMSYKDYTNLVNPDAEENILATYGDEMDINSALYSWMLSFNQVSQTGASKQKDIGVEVGANVGAYGISLEASSNYNRSELKTYSTTVDSNFSVKADITTGLNTLIGAVRYHMTPYVYWAKSGALVLDYAARPETGSTTWWYQNYNIQDPALIMPWRYDPDKGFHFGASEALKRRQTKSVMMYPQTAATGDTVRLEVVVHNFGLQPTSGPIDLKFYVGDPIHQQVITDINGNSTFSIPLIGERDRQIIDISWVVPAGIYKSPKIYASIDPANTISELHRNNNIGWNVFTITDGSNIDPDTVTSVNDLNESVSLVECFPNPFGNDIRLSYEMKNAGAAKITVMDVTGKILATPLNQPQSSGIHSFSYDASALSSGIYFFNFSLPGYSETKRLVKVEN